MKKEYEGLEAVLIPFNNEKSFISTTSLPCTKVYVTHFDKDPVDNLCDAPQQTEVEPSDPSITWTELWGDEPD